MTTYYKVKAISPDGWSDWFQPVRKGHRLGCCDCGLVHEVDFRVHRGAIQLRVRRLERSTAAKRRQNNFECKPVRRKRSRS